MLMNIKLEMLSTKRFVLKSVSMLFMRLNPLSHSAELQGILRMQCKIGFWSTDSIAGFSMKSRIPRIAWSTSK